MKICEECGRAYDDEGDNFLHLLDTNHRVVCRKSFNSLHCTTELRDVTCPDCLVQNAAPRLLEACRIIKDHKKTLDSERCFVLHLTHAEWSVIKAAIAEAEKK